MQTEQFIARVREHGDFADGEEATAATRATLQTLAQRIVGGEATDLASELPTDVARYLQQTAGRTAEAEIFDADEFCRRVAESEGGATDPQIAREHIAAVMTAVREAVSEGAFSDVLGQLPDDIRTIVAR